MAGGLSVLQAQLWESLQALCMGKAGIPFPAEMEELLPQPVRFSFHQVYAKI